jgi:beta-lactamase class A
VRYTWVIATNPIPLKTFWLHTVFPTVVLMLVLVLMVQLLVPYDRTLPGARIGEVAIGGRSLTDAAQVLRKAYSITPVDVRVDGKVIYETTVSQAGMTPDYAPAIEVAMHYPLWQRLVPFSLVHKVLKPQISLGHQVDKEVFADFASKVMAKCTVQPKDAAVSLVESKAVLVSSTKGRVCEQSSLLSAVTSVDLATSTVALRPTTKVVQPRWDDAVMRTQLVAAQTALDRGLEIASTVDRWQVPRSTVATWLKVADVNGAAKLTVDEGAVKAYLETLRSKLYIEPGQSVTDYVDGVAVTSTTGESGRGLDAEVTSQRVSAVLTGAGTDSIAWVQLAVLPPRQINGHSYTPTPRGVQALVTQWRSAQPAGRYAVQVRDLTGRGMNAELHADDDFVTASTFKMFLAYAVLHKVELGQMSLDAPTDQGLSVKGCIEEMIHHSTNPCAVALFNMANWGYVHAFIRDKYPHTIMDNSVAADYEKHSTMRDELDFLEQLHAGVLLNPEHTGFLIDLFKHQVWRDGIPAGIRDVTVADKVGFYAGYRHDVAIVYAPRGTYLLGIMSKGGNEAGFADLSRQLYALMKQN